MFVGAGRQAPRLCEGGQGAEKVDLQGTRPRTSLAGLGDGSCSAPCGTQACVSAHRPTGWSRWHGPAVGVGLAAPWQPGQLGQGQSWGLRGHRGVQPGCSQPSQCLSPARAPRPGGRDLARPFLHPRPAALPGLWSDRS